MTAEEFQTAIDALASGDTASLQRIYEEYVKLIYSVVYDLVKRKEDAEDITSEFFVKLVRVAGSFRAGSPHKAWMVQIARNMSIDFLRKHNREQLLYKDEDSESSNANDPMEELGAKEHQASVESQAILAEDMRNAMETLNTKEKEIVDLKLMGQLTFREISALTGQPMGTVTWLYNQAIKKLRRCLASYE